MRISQNSFFRSRLPRVAHLYDSSALLPNELTSSKANPPSDIIRKNLGSDRALALMKKVALFILLVFFSFVIMTPTYAINMLAPLESQLEDTLKHVPFNASQLLSDFFAPLIVIAINFLLIPTLIQLSTMFEDHYLYSEIQHAQLWRIFFFMLLNVLLIPITEATTALALMDKFEATDAKEWPTLLSSNMMAQ